MSQDLKTETALNRQAIKRMQKDIDDLKTEVKDGFESVHDKVDQFIASADEKYAGKWMEKAVAALLLSAVGYIVIELIKLI